MGYTTEFYGEVVVDPPLNEAEASYLNDFAATRRMDRSKGPYFVRGSGFMGQGHDDDVRNFNNPPAGQPGLWCQWVPTPNGGAIEWDGGEKFYFAAEWMKYLIEHFLKPGAKAKGSDTDPRFAEFTFDHVVNGKIEARGEDPDDYWWLIVEDNVVKTAHAIISVGEAREV